MIFQHEQGVSYFDALTRVVPTELLADLLAIFYKLVMPMAF
jgi:hypothetical protein